MATIGVSPRAGRRAGPCGREDDLDRGHVAEARHAVAREAGVEDLAVVELDRLEQRAAEALHDGALDLVPQVVGVDDRAALEGGHDADDLAPGRSSRSTATSAQVAT